MTEAFPVALEVPVKVYTWEIDFLHATRRLLCASSV